MRFYLLLLLIVCLLITTEARSKKKSSLDEGKTKRRSKEGTPSAIVAIEIVDPNGNKTNGKNSKRTIDSSLGYGYQSFIGATHQQPKYEVYKYSQHDIPPYKGTGQNLFSHYQKPPQRYTQSYQPGTTLYSTINQNGQLGGLSSHIPHSQGGNHGTSPIPVIILRVYPSQLNDVSNSLYPKLPQNHPQASYLNSIDLQSLLSGYYQEMQQQPPQYVHQQPSQYDHQQPSQYVHQQPSQYVHQQYEQPQQYIQYQQPQELLTHENYPSEAHTKVIFRDNKGKVKTTQTEEPNYAPVQTKTIKIHVPPGIAGVEVQTPEANTEQQYIYANDGQEQQYQYDDQPSFYYYNSQIDQQYQEPTTGQHQQQQQQQVVYQEQTEKYQEPSQYDRPPQQQYVQSNYEQPSDSRQHTHHKRKLRSKKSGDESLKME